MRLSSPHPTIKPETGCVVSYCAVASSIGNRVLRQGGNAVDSAVATALALAVTYPQAGNLGGGGFLLLHHAGGEQHFLDYRECAPRRIAPDLLRGPPSELGSRSVIGARSVGVPGTVAGLAEVLARFGTWPWARVVAPAVELAEAGTWLTTRQAAYLELHHRALAHFPSTRRYFTDEGELLLPGTLWRQPALGATLRMLADEGPRAFYEGAIAERIVASIADDGGVLDREDLRSYVPRWRTPLRRRFCGREVVSAALPSGGGMVAQLALGLLEACQATSLPVGSIERLELLARIFRVAFAVSHSLAGDPDHLAPDQLDEAAAWAERAFEAGDLPRLEADLVEAQGGDRALGSNTTHFCVLDRMGNAVSNTYSLNTLFGSKLAVDGAGFLLNNSIDDFLIEHGAPNWYDLVPGERNQLRPGYRPVSSMAPTIALAPSGDVELIIGGSGGPRIPTLIVQLALSVLGDDLPLDQAVRQPRVHHQFRPDELAVESTLPATSAEALAARGYAIKKLPLLGIGAGIRRDPVTRELQAALDGRFSLE